MKKRVANKGKGARGDRSEVRASEERDTAFCAFYVVCLAGCVAALLLLHVPFWLAAILGIVLGSLLFYGLWFAGSHFLNWVTRGRYFENESGFRPENVVPPGLIIVIFALCLYPVFVKAKHKAQAEVRKAQIRAQSQAQPQITPSPAASAAPVYKGTQE